MKKQNSTDSLLDAFQNQQISFDQIQIKGGDGGDPWRPVATAWQSSTGTFFEKVYPDGDKKYYNVIGNEVTASYLISNGDNNII